MKFLKLLLVASLFLGTLAPALAELQDQGLSSIMSIIDKAIEDMGAQDSDDEEANALAIANSTATIVNLSRTLGNLSYSRLQCGEAGVLAEFTQRVQQMPETSRDAMRDAFQEGFDKSKEETPLLSQDECARLTRSRNRSEQETEANVAEEKTDVPVAEVETPEVEAEPVVEDPRFRHLRIAELSGQLAYKRKFCEDEEVFNRDYNEYLESVPSEYRDDVKDAYWRGYKRGKSLNRNLTEAQCQSSK